jgi:hypothetical protein
MFMHITIGPYLSWQCYAALDIFCEETNELYCRMIMDLNVKTPASVQQYKNGRQKGNVTSPVLTNQL